MEKQMTTFRYNAHPMGMTIATIASLSTFHPEGKFKVTVLFPYSQYITV